MKEEPKKEISKRSFLRGLGALGFSAATAPVATEQIANFLSRDSIEQKKQARIDHLQKRYSSKDGPILKIDINLLELRARETGIKGGDVLIEQINSPIAELVTLENLTDVLSQYPPGLIQKNVHRIGIGAALTQEWLFPLRVGGLAERNSRAGGHVLFTTIRGLAMSVNLPTNILRPYFVALGKTLRESTTHHEIGHLLLGNDDNNYNEWLSLNPPGFTYPGPGIKEMESKISGFARGYGQMNVHEDLATVFESMMVDYRELMQRVESSKDEVLANKISYIKNKLYAADSRITDKYWVDRSNNRITEKYWD